MPVSGMNQELLSKAEHLGMFINQSSRQFVTLRVLRRQTVAAFSRLISLISINPVLTCAQCSRVASAQGNREFGCLFFQRLKAQGIYCK